MYYVSGLNENPLWKLKRSSVLQKGENLSRAKETKITPMFHQFLRFNNILVYVLCESRKTLVVL